MASTVFLWWEIVRQTERQRQRERETERKWERERRKETEIVHVHFWAMCAHVQVFALHVYRSMCTHVHVYRIDLCLHCPSLNAFCSHCFVLYCFIVQHAKLWCIPGVRALSVFHYHYHYYYYYTQYRHYCILVACKFWYSWKPEQKHYIMLIILW